MQLAFGLAAFIKMMDEKQTAERKKTIRRRHNTAPIPYPDQIHFTPGNVFFTADTHFYSKRILKYRSRFSSLFDMNETLIQRWNETVPEDGVVFHLGDFCSEVPKEKVAELIGRLNGTILLILGNHDDVGLYRSKKFQEETGIKALGYQWQLSLDGQRIILNHYPLLCYAGEYDGTWQLFGHVHSGSESEGFDIPRLQYLLPWQYDVGVDGNGYRPLSFEEIREIMERRK